MPFGIVQFVPGYHFFADAFGIHAEITTLLLGGIYSTILFYGLQHNHPTNYLEHGERQENRGDKKSGAGKWYYDEAFAAVCVHYIHYAILVVFANPQDTQVLGMHQPQGSAPGSGDAFDCAQTRNLTYPYPFTPNGFPGMQRDWFPDVEVWKRPYLCEGGVLMDEGVQDYHCPMAQAQTWKGEGNMWYWMCGTDWTNAGETSHVEYIMLVWVICIVGLNLFAMAYVYPRTLYEQFFELGEFPRYYKTNNPEDLVLEIKDRRIGKDGVEEYKVSQTKYDGSSSRVDQLWRKKTDLVMDAVGAVYGERGGHYGMMHDTYGGSTRDRLRCYDTLQHSLERLALHEASKVTNRKVGKRNRSKSPFIKRA